ncbi:hypothetical protein DFQ27_008034 [Actinomortierella ambigua]|uniref:Uncharacterized protein n=1 Tax=Actinomortierella ambigua TaxID=1343610 RepID=A0A9P6TYW5_9FUNG|nr:hypothetical protein DFQ27_008034 [Actinomortierella ambigua]
MSYDNRVFGELPQHKNMVLFSTLVWAACGHRLGGVKQIAIPCRDLGRYVQHVHEMTNISSIQLHLPDAPAIRLQGWDQDKKTSILSDLGTVVRFMDRWVEATANNGARCMRRPVDFRFVGCVDDEGWWSEEPFAELFQRIFRHMPISTTQMIDCCSRLEWARLVLAPETIDLSHLKTLIARQRYDDETELPWPKQSMSTILRQCRSLQHLDLMLRRRDEDSFDWAAHERRVSRTLPLVDFPRVHQLTLALCDVQLDPRVWTNALLAFGPTLRSITIDDTLHSHTLDIAAFHDLPEVEQLCLLAGGFEHSLPGRPFAGCNKLQHLILNQERDKYDMPQLAPWDLPTVSHLVMSGSVMYQFSQETFSTMPKLETLQLLDFSGDQVVFSWDLDNWLPTSLRVLRLIGPPAQAFKWAMLQQCPLLMTLELTSSVTEIHVRPSLAFNDSGSTSSVHPTMETLVLASWDMSAKDVVDKLPLLFPNLRTLTLTSCIELTDEEKSMLEKKLPSLLFLHCECLYMDDDQTDSERVSDIDSDGSSISDFLDEPTIFF